MKKFLNTFLAIFTGIPLLWILIIVVSIVVGFIFKDARVGFWMLFFLVASMTLFVIGRQIYWAITKTGDYDDSKK